MSIQDIYNFFFEYKIQASFAAVLRILYCSFPMLWFLSIIKDCWEFSKPDGIFNAKKYSELSMQFSLFDPFLFSKFFHKLIFILFFIFGVTSIIGLFTNISLIIFFIAFASIQSRIFPIIATGGDSIIRMMLISLMFIDCGAKYSIDNLLGFSSNSEIIDGWTLRLLQLNLCIIYLLSAIVKLKDQEWINGNVVKYSIFCARWGRKIVFKLPLNKNLELIFKLLTWSIIFYEYFSFPLFFISELRPFAIIFGIFFHLGTILFMRIGAFGPIMVLALLSFANQYFANL